MEREIKFRGWDGLNMQYSDTLVYNREEGYLRFDLPAHLVGPMTTFKVMQFIGLKDKKGKEIFEKDVVKYNGENWHIKYEPYWSSGWILDGGWFKSGEVKFKPLLDARKWGENAIGYYDLEVIGNVFENAELLTNN